jgi:hypothetical protein
LALKIYSKGERVLRIEAVAHNIREFNCGRLLDNFPKIVGRLKGMLEKFMEALSCIDQCFIGDEMLERLPLATRVGKSMVSLSVILCAGHNQRQGGVLCRAEPRSWTGQLLVCPQSRKSLSRNS